MIAHHRHLPVQPRLGFSNGTGPLPAFTVAVASAFLALLIAAAFAAVFVPLDVHAASSPADLCAADKLRAVQRYDLALANCFAAEARGPGSLASCLGEAGNDLRAAFAVAEARASRRGSVCPGTPEQLGLAGDNRPLETYVVTSLLTANTLPDECTGTKAGAAARLAAALANCDSKYVRNPDPSMLESCVTRKALRFTRAWQAAEQRATCVGDPAATARTTILRLMEALFDTLRFGESFIESPVDGEFFASPTVQVRGAVVGAVDVASISVNGIAVIPEGEDHHFSLELPLHSDAVFDPILAEVTAADGTRRRQRITVVATDPAASFFLPAGQRADNGLTLAVPERGLAQIQETLGALAVQALDLEQFLLDRNPVIEGACVVSAGPVCTTKADADVTAAGFGAFDVAVSTQADATVRAVSTVGDLQVSTTVHTYEANTGLPLFDCNMNLHVDRSDITAAFALAPTADGSAVDADQVGDVSLDLSGFAFEFASGPCDDPVLGPVIRSLVEAKIEPLVRQSFVEALGDPDGAGPEDAALADAFEVALAAFDVPTVLGQTLGADIDARFRTVRTDEDGLLFRLDAAVSARQQNPDAPMLSGSYGLLEEPPVFGALTPGSGVPYGLGLGIAATTFNQVLAAQIEGGLLHQDVTAVDLGLGTGPIPLTVSILTVFLPELRALPGVAPVVVELRPTLAPIIDGKPGPDGELLSLRTGGLRVRVVLPTQQRAVLELAVDLKLGTDLVFRDGGLAFDVGAFHPELTDVEVVSDLIGIRPEHIRDLVNAMFPLALPLVEEALGTFPLPPVAGIPLSPLEATTSGPALELFLDFDPAAARLH